jgi:trehalose 6-phosphate synthase
MPIETARPPRTLILTHGVRDGCDPERRLLAPALARAARGATWVDLGPDAPQDASTGRLDPVAPPSPAADAFVANTLRPLFTGRLGAMRWSATQERAWRRSARDEAARLAPRLAPGDRLLAVGIESIGMMAALRSAGVPVRGTLLIDAPVPPAETLAQLPSHARLFALLAGWELVAVPDERSAVNLRSYCARELDATLLAAGALRLRGRPMRIVVHAIAVDARTRAADALRAAPPSAPAELLALDAIDGSRALPERMRAYSRLLSRCAEGQPRPSLLQLTAPVAADAQAAILRRRVLALATRINGRHGDPDWTPVRCVDRGWDLDALAGYARSARVGLCTPLTDAASLAAQDFVACQEAEDPGVIVLSRGAAAATWMEGALLVDARDPAALASVIGHALEMPAGERRHRWQLAHRAMLRREGSTWIESLLARIEEPAAPASTRRTVLPAAHAEVAAIAEPRR